MLGRGLHLKTNNLLDFVFVFCEIFEKFVNDRLFDHLQSCGLSDSQYGTRSSQSTAYLLTVVSDKIARGV